MIQPNELGYYHRDIVHAEKLGRNYLITMSCGHQTKMSWQGYKKYKDHAHLCVECSLVKV